MIRLVRSGAHPVGEWNRGAFGKAGRAHGDATPLRHSIIPKSPRASAFGVRDKPGQGIDTDALRCDARRRWMSPSLAFSPSQRPVAPRKTSSLKRRLIPILHWCCEPSSVQGTISVSSWLECACARVNMGGSRDPLTLTAVASAWHQRRGVTARLA
ncbi:hypothetical protein IE81DRAFT_322273 [Ceraceosorus guamensis]|uniref:Uncharacterized protein n=1 Tax=Ceraceosorus guamensis TaxID=1522189 RepID=A0A316W1R3_9BASI|nr:hypothetical protein IE81DRAFT_322273 [Ceraceosorus guamensis]PWN43619.1 hypothetical protein IE81DRAFT_322273 [Ceraceosorus guamensis]